MNKKALAAFGAALLLALTGCADSDELYDDGRYYGSSFVDNVYTKWDDGLKGATLNHKYELTSDGSASSRYFCGSGAYSTCEDCVGFAQAKSWLGSKGYFKHNGRDLLWSLSSGGGEGGAFGFDTYASPGTINPKDSELFGIVYSQTKKLSNYSDKFKRGILSKLYNGQIKCDAWSYLSMVLLDQRGYGTLFPCQLVSAPYFAFSARGASDTYGSSRVTTFNFDVSFYKFENDKFVKDTFVLSSAHLQTNRSSEITALVGFDFADLGYDPKGMVGMSIVPSVVEDPGNNTTIDFEDDTKDHIGVSLLEVMFPDSTWN